MHPVSHPADFVPPLRQEVIQPGIQPPRHLLKTIHSASRPHSVPTAARHLIPKPLFCVRWKPSTARRCVSWSSSEMKMWPALSPPLVRNRSISWLIKNCLIREAIWSSAEELCLAHQLRRVRKWMTTISALSVREFPLSWKNWMKSSGSSVFRQKPNTTR